MRIPSTTRIVNRALDLRGDALNQNDPATVRKIDTMIRNLYCGMKLKWDSGDGALVITSCNTAGASYRVGQQSCTCPAYSYCNHLRLRDLLIDMAETDAETADMAAS